MTSYKFIPIVYMVVKIHFLITCIMYNTFIFCIIQKSHFFV